MPHIKHIEKQKYYNIITALEQCEISNKGHLEFLVFRLMKQYMWNNFLH